MNTNAFHGWLRSWQIPRLPRLIFPLLAGIFAARVAVAAVPEGPSTADIRYDADTQLVTVKTPFGEPQVGSLSDVHPDSFVVYENGQRQTKVNVSVEHSPISIGVLIEYGGRYRALNEALGNNGSSAIRELLKDVGPDDHLSVWKYADNVEPISGDLRPGGALKGAFVSPPTPPISEVDLHDALSATLFKMQAMPGPKALVLISTGVNTFSKASFAGVLAETRRAGVPIYVINLGPAVRSDVSLYIGGEHPYAALNWSLAESRLAALARASGGRMYSPASQPEMAGVYDELMASLRTRYVIQYTSHNTAALDRPRIVRVELAEGRTASTSPRAIAGSESTRAKRVAEVKYVPGAASHRHENASVSGSEAAPAAAPHH